MFPLRLLLIGILSGIALHIYAQVPSTELYLFQLIKSDTVWHIHSPQMLSGFNPGGYTNQPAFINDDLLYVSVRKKGDEQNDIYGLHLDSKQIERITQTPESEYSPTLTSDGKYFSCIRQNDTDTVDQRLFKYPIDRTSNGKDVLENQYQIGYHAWLNNSELALFQVTTPPTLAWANIQSREVKRVLSNVGRCLKCNNKKELVYVHKYIPEVWYVKTLSSPDASSDILIETPKGCEDFAISTDGTIFMSKGSILYSFRPGFGENWKIVADLSIYGLEEISRLAINSRDEIAVVDVRQNQ